MKPNYKLSIFTVEDNPLYSMALNYSIADTFNFRITSFESAEECLKNVHLKPDIIILDYLLKGMNGHKALVMLKQALPNVYIIVVSQQKELEVAVDLIKAGAYSYIAKDEQSLKTIITDIQKIRVELEKKYKGIIP